jgi:hypothetical protein
MSLIIAKESYDKVFVKLTLINRDGKSKC